MQKEVITNQLVKDSKGWDCAGDYTDIQLYEGTLQVDTINHKKGDVISCISFLFTQSVAEFYDIHGNLTETVPLKLSFDIDKGS